VIVICILRAVIVTSNLAKHTDFSKIVLRDVKHPDFALVLIGYISLWENTNIRGQ
jgi:hypothetical protein